MVAVKANCRVCSKAFCCTDCRDIHEKKKHPQPISKAGQCSSCSLCAEHTLAFNPSKDKNKDELIGHLLFHHLPLHCKLCGEVYTSGKDFSTATPCRWWYVEKQPKPSQSGAASSSEAKLGAAGPGSQLPVTPQLLLVSETEKSLRIGDTSSLAHLKPDNNLDSPPAELVRLTSTPLHVAGGPCQKQTNSSSSIPHFRLSKTPSSFDKRSTFDSTSGVGASIESSESRFYTGTSSIIDEQIPQFSKLNLSSGNVDNKSENRSEAELSCFLSPSVSILKKQHVDPMSGEVVMKSNSLSRANDTLEKRVRFSDQCSASAASTTSGSAADESDVFFEARESFEESEAAAKGDPCACCGGKESCQKDSELVVSSTTSDEKSPAKPEVGPAAVSATTSSRVFMMLVMEQTDAKTFSSKDLHTLIDSGLKQLEKHSENSSIVANLKADNCECSSKKSATPGCVTYNSEVLNFSRKVDTESIVVSKDSGVQRTLIKDSCMNITDHIECYPAGESKQPAEASARVPHERKEEVAGNSDSSSGTGIFSAMARAVRCALSKLPVQAINQAITYTMPSPLSSLVPTTMTAAAATTRTTKNLSRESMSQSSFAAPLPATPIPSPILSRYCTSLASPRLPLPGAITLKRSREAGDELAFSTPRERDSPGSSSSSGSQSEGMLSPALKRYRGCYKIKARQPIARMRQRQVLASPRGASRETQRFQQGSLTVGDTLLPLPSRAHQSTKTVTEAEQS